MYESDTITFDGSDVRRLEMTLKEQLADMLAEKSAGRFTDPVERIRYNRTAQLLRTVMKEKTLPSYVSVIDITDSTMDRTHERIGMDAKPSVEYGALGGTSRREIAAMHSQK